MNNTYALGFMAACNAAGLNKQAADMLYKQARVGKAGKIAFQRLMANVAKAAKKASKAKGAVSKALPSATHYPIVPVSGSRALVPVAGSRAVVPVSGSRALVPVTGSRAVVPVTGSRALVPSTAERAIAPHRLSVENGGVEVLDGVGAPKKIKTRSWINDPNRVDADHTMVREKALPKKVRKSPNRRSRRPAPAPATTHVPAPAPSPVPVPAPAPVKVMDTPIPTQVDPQLGSFREWAKNNPWGLALGSGAAGYMLGRHNNR